MAHDDSLSAEILGMRPLAPPLRRTHDRDLARCLLWLLALGLCAFVWTAIAIAATLLLP